MTGDIDYSQEFDGSLELSNVNPIYAADKIIQNGNLGIIQTLIDKNIITYQHIQTIVSHDRVDILELIFNEEFIEQNIAAFSYALKNGKLDIIKFFASFCELPENGIVLGAVSEKKNVLLWIYQNYAVTLDDIRCLSDLNCQISVDIFVSCKVIEACASNDNDLIVSIINMMEFKFDLGLLKTVWDTIKFSLLKALIYDSNFSLLLDICAHNILIPSDMWTVMNIVNRSSDDAIMIMETLSTMLSDLHKKELIKIYIDTLDIVDIYDDIYRYRRVTDDNLSQIKNELSFMAKHLKDIMNDEIIFMDDNNYAYVLSELLETWDYGLSGYDYLIKPKYPRNPYTNVPFHPKELLLVMKYAHVHNIPIPQALAFIVRRPTFLYESFKLAHKDNDETQYMRTQLMRYMKYTGGQSEHNMSGKWELDKDKLSAMEYDIYSDCSLSIFTINAIIVKLHNLAKKVA
jgi:hypothetical protein